VHVSINLCIFFPPLYFSLNFGIFKQIISRNFLWNLKNNLSFSKPENGTMVFIFTKVQHFVATKLFLRS